MARTEIRGERKPASVFTAIVVLVGTALHAVGQPTTKYFPDLPPPSGSFAIGRVTVQWVDESRIEPFSANSSGRQLMVDIWYPANSGTGPAAAYLNVAVFEQALGVDGLRKQFGGAYDA